MFQDSVLEVRGGGRLRWIAMASVVAQAGLVAGLVAYPLLYPAALPVTARVERRIVTLEPVKPPKPLKPVEVKVADAAAMPASAPASAAAGTRTATIHREPVVAGQDIPALLQMGATMGSGANLPLAGGPGGPGGTGTRVTVRPASGDGNNNTGGRVRISTGVSAGLLLTPIQPVYPRIAKAAGISGTVVVTATIDAQGRIVGAKAISGPLMLRQAAAEAVMEARYRPFLLNGQPTEVETTFSINFVMGS
jgi:protein TonB